MQIRSKAPLRISLAGGGTDLNNYSDTFGGAILNATISMYAYSTIRTKDKADAALIKEEEKLLNPVEIKFIAADKEEEVSFKLTELAPLEINGQLDLHKAIFNRILKDYRKDLVLGLNRVESLEITTYVDAPAGSGLGTSSTLVVAIIGSFQEWLHLPLGEYDLADLAYSIERVDLDMAGGKQDQYAATFGGFNFMEFYKDNRIIVNPLRIRQEYLNELEFNILLFHTGKNRFSSTIISKQEANVTENKTNSLDAMHKLKEKAYEMKEALLKGQFNKIGEILDIGWQYKKDTATEVTNSLIDEMYETAKKAGATGGKISGAGGGGFMMVFCPRISRYNVIKALEKFGSEFRRYNFTKTGLRTWKTS